MSDRLPAASEFAGADSGGVPRSGGVTDWSAQVAAKIAAAACDGVSGVIRRDGGALGEIATFGVDGAVPGVRFEDRAADRAVVELRVVTAIGRPVDAVADDVRTAVVQAWADQWPRRAAPVVNVHVADVEAPAIERQT